MKWIIDILDMSNAEGNIFGKRFTLLRIFHLLLLISNNKGRHFSVGLGIGPFEIALQFSLWVPDRLWSDNVGKS